MKKVFFVLLVSAVFFISCDTDDMEEQIENIPENIFTGNAWEYKSYNGDILRYYIKISFTENEFIIYTKTDTAGIENPGKIYEDTTSGIYSLFYEEKTNPPFGHLLDERIEFISNNVRLNGVAGYTTKYFFGIDNPAPDGHVVFSNKSGDCSLVTISIDGTLGYIFIPVN